MPFTPIKESTTLGAPHNPTNRDRVTKNKLILLVVIFCGLAFASLGMYPTFEVPGGSGGGGTLGRSSAHLPIPHLTASPSRSTSEWGRPSASRTTPRGESNVLPRGDKTDGAASSSAVQKETGVAGKAERKPAKANGGGETPEPEKTSGLKLPTVFGRDDISSEDYRKLAEPFADVAGKNIPEFDMPPCAAQYFKENYDAQLGNPQSMLVEHRETVLGKSDYKNPLNNNENIIAALRRKAGIDHTYMIHYAPMRDRRREISELLAIQGIYPLHWVLGFDRENITDAMADCFSRNWEAGKAVSTNSVKKQRHSKIQQPKLKPSQISVVVKHHSALYDAVRSGYKRVMILEDDALLRVEFPKRLTEIMRDAPKDYDVLMIGGCMRMHGYRAKFKAKRITKHIFEKQEARCAHAFVVTGTAAKKILDSIPLTFPIDFQLTRAMVEQGLKTYWIEPYLSVQGQFGGCVTNQLGAKCVSTHKYERAFDVKGFLNNRQTQGRWDLDVPELG